MTNDDETKTPLFVLRLQAHYQYLERLAACQSAEEVDALEADYARWCNGLMSSLAFR